MNVTLKQLEAFVAVADTGSFTAAAQAIHVSQPALSSLIQNLERQLGARLFERDSRGASITTTGRELLPSIKKVLNELNETVAAVLHATLPRGGSCPWLASPRSQPCSCRRSLQNSRRYIRR